MLWLFYCALVFPSCGHVALLTVTGRPETVQSQLTWFKQFCHNILLQGRKPLKPCRHMTGNKGRNVSFLQSEEGWTLVCEAVSSAWVMTADFNWNKSHWEFADADELLVLNSCIWHASRLYLFIWSAAWLVLWFGCVLQSQALFSVHLDVPCCSVSVCHCTFVVIWKTVKERVQ